MITPTTRFASFLRRLSLAAAVSLAAFALAGGCDVDSVDSTSSVVSDNSGTIYNFAGMYMNPNNSSSTNSALPIVFPEGRQSGVALTWMRLLQYGSVLEAYDNASQKWSGSISSLQGSTATFSLRGQTSAGQAVDIVGTMTYASQQSTIDAAWIEPAFSGTFNARATVTPANTNSPAPALTLAPTSASLNTNVVTATFTATGGSGSYVWSVSDTTRGTVSPSTGSTVVYTSTRVAGSNTIRVTDTAGATRTAVATYQ